jgi:hypothetical protein
LLGLPIVSDIPVISSESCAPRICSGKSDVPLFAVFILLQRKGHERHDKSYGKLPTNHSVENWIDSYFESFSKADPDSGQSPALDLKRANFPRALYRYRSLESLGYRLDELRNGYVFLNNPGEFNDPYDSALSTSLASFFTQVLEPYGYGDQSTVSDAIKSLGDLGANIFSDLLTDFTNMLYGYPSPPKNRDMFDALRNLIRVGCFTTNSNSVVMWSHYANRHTGICVEFSGSSMLSSKRFLELVHPVQYADKLFDLVQIFSTVLPEIDPGETPSSSVPGVNPDCWPILAACQKSEEWSYENEWRLVSLDPAGHKGPRFSLADCNIKPSRVILGTRIDQADQAAVTELAERISVPVVKARLARDRFEIEF